MPLYMLVVDHRGEARHVRHEGTRGIGHPYARSVTARVAGKACGRGGRLFPETFFGGAPPLGGSFPEFAPADARAPARGLLGGAGDAPGRPRCVARSAADLRSVALGLLHVV